MKRPSARVGHGFTLIEVLVATTVLVVIMGILLGITSQVSDTWRRTTGEIEQFREARDGFESMTRRLRQATLNTFWDYNSVTAPTNYVRQSELRFISGPASALVSGGGDLVTQAVFFQAPLGMVVDAPDAEGLEELLNTWGYFVEFGDDLASRPSIITTAISPPQYRYRLYEFMEPANELSIYTHTSGVTGAVPNNLTYNGRQWFDDAMARPAATRPARPLANNIIALVILPKLSAQEDPTESRLAPNYLYDSTVENADPQINPKNQLPPVLQVTMVAIDEVSAKRLASGSTPPDFGLGSLFRSASAYESDLATLEATLNQKKVSYRVFTSAIAIQGAKWSTEQ